MSQRTKIGIVGGGQLGRMLTEAALPLGFEVIVVDPTPYCPAAQAGAEQIRGDFYDEAAIRQLAERADVITVETEHVNTDVLAQLTKSVHPAARTIRMIQDKYEQKVFLQGAGIPVAGFVALKGQDDARDALVTYGGKMLIKSRHGAYDGRGNMVVSDPGEIKQAFETLSNELYAEKYIPYKKELAVMVARGTDGTLTTYPLTETIHQRNICIETLTPAQVPDDIAAQATQIALRVAEQLEGAGVFGIEMFLTKDDKILVNEIAPRVHNSGHYTIEACRTSQFEQHIRAISGLELGSTDLKVPAAVMINILGERDGDTLTVDLKSLEMPGTFVHIYGKSPTKVDRKMGHLTAVGDTVEAARQSALAVRKLIKV